MMNVDCSFMVVMVDFDFVADVFFHAHPVKEEFHEDLNIFLAEKFVILEGISIVKFGSIVYDEIVYVVDDIPDGLLFEFIEGIVVWFCPIFVLVFDVLNALVEVFCFLGYLLIRLFYFGDFMVVLVLDLILFIILIIVLLLFNNFFLLIFLF
jgi:hypothetical protein